MVSGGVVAESTRTVTNKAKKEVFRREPWPKGTMLMSFKLTIGKVTRLGTPAYFNEAIFAFDSGEQHTNQYLFTVLPLMSMSADSIGAIKGRTLNSGSISSMLIPLPPLAEQKRIVAKVDELMSLCDELEVALVERRDLSVRLARSGTRLAGSGAK